MVGSKSKSKKSEEHRRYTPQSAFKNVNEVCLISPNKISVERDLYRDVLSRKEQPDCRLLEPRKGDAHIFWMLRHDS